MVCPNCGASIQIDADKNNLTCDYCGNNLYIDDEVQHVQYDNAEETGYRFEKGRQRAQTEARGSGTSHIYTRPVAVSNSSDKTSWGVILVFVIIIFVVIGIIRGKKDTSKSTWSEKDTPISKFEYYLEGDYVYLKKYKGRDKKVKIGTSYKVNGKTYQVAPEIKGLFALKSVTSVILPEGITTMPNNTFNSCGVKYIYIPKTLQPGEKGYGFYDYFHDVEKIYYGGSEEEWGILTHNKPRSDIDVKEIVYNAKIEDLK